MIPLLVQIAVPLMRASLAAVLVAAGAAKLVDLHGFATTLIGLGIPARWERLVHALTLAVPLLEISLGLALVSGFWPTAISVAALALMCGFSIVVLVALRKVPNVACRCFGALSDSQFSGKGLARSLSLTVLAFVTWWSGNAYPVLFDRSPGAAILLVAGYLLFAAAAAQAAATIAAVKAKRFV
jgi:uncharacterized membrane protein YphA (DoxX/SURF4 family)